MASFTLLFSLFGAEPAPWRATTRERHSSLVTTHCVSTRISLHYFIFWEGGRGAGVEVRVLSSYPMCPGDQTQVESWWQVPLPAELSSCPPFFFLFFFCLAKSLCVIQTSLEHSCLSLPNADRHVPSNLTVS